MKLLQRHRAVDLPGTTGPARIDRRTARLASRLKPGEIAVLDHVDLDRVSADALVAAGCAAVVNASPSISGRYPNLGPEVLLAAGVPLLDDVGNDVLGAVRDGEHLRLDGDTLYSGDRVVAVGEPQDAHSIGAAMDAARTGLVHQLEAFAANTREFLLQERDLLLDGVGFPEIRTRLDGRHALIVVRGYDYREDLQLLRRYLKDYRPVLIGVDGGADALAEAGYAPDLLVGDMDAVSDAVLRSGAEVVVHADADGIAPSLPRVQDLGVQAVVFSAAGTSEDVALLLADEGGASLIVTVGTHATLEEFLDKGRQGMASSFLTRLRVGGKLVDALGASQLYRRRMSAWPLLALVLAAVLVMVVAASLTPTGPALGDLLSSAVAHVGIWFDDLSSWVHATVTG